MTPDDIAGTDTDQAAYADAAGPPARRLLMNRESVFDGCTGHASGQYIRIPEAKCAPAPIPTSRTHEHRYMRLYLSRLLRRWAERLHPHRNMRINEFSRVTGDALIDVDKDGSPVIQLPPDTGITGRFSKEPS